MQSLLFLWFSWVTKKNNLQKFLSFDYCFFQFAKLWFGTEEKIAVDPLGEGEVGNCSDWGQQMISLERFLPENTEGRRKLCLFSC